MPRRRRLIRLLAIILFSGWLARFMLFKTNDTVLEYSPRNITYGEGFYVRKFETPCESIIKGEVTGSTLLPDLSRIPTDYQWYRALKLNGCSTIFDSYYFKPRSGRQTPVAYSSQESSRFDALLSRVHAMFDPHNFYCFHVDVKSPFYFHEAIQSLATCVNQRYDSSVMMVETIPEPVVWGGRTMLLSQLACMKRLLQFKGWQHVFLLQAGDFPLRTPNEIRKILRILGDRNDVEFLGSFPTDRLWRVEDTVDSDGKPDGYQKTKKTTEDPPHQLQLYKGYAASTLTRKVVEFIFSSKVAQDLLAWVTENTLIPDETFVPTLVHNPQLNLSHGSTCQNDYFTRYSVWLSPSWRFWPDFNCKSGNWRKMVCLFGLDDLPDVVKQRYVFANKIRDPLTEACLHEFVVRRSLNLDPFDVNDHWTANLYRNLTRPKLRVCP